MKKTVPANLAAHAQIMSVVTALPVFLYDLTGRLAFTALETLLMNAALILSIVFYMISMAGFAAIGYKYQNPLLAQAATVLSAGAFVYGANLILGGATAQTNLIASLIVIGVFGAASIAFGFGLNRLTPHFGQLASSAGLVEVVLGACLLSVVLSPVALILSVPAYVLSFLLLRREAARPPGTGSRV